MMTIMRGSCCFVRCKHEKENGECELNINPNGLIMCREFDYDDERTMEEILGDNDD